MLCGRFQKMALILNTRVRQTVEPGRRENTILSQFLIHMDKSAHTTSITEHSCKFSFVFLIVIFDINYVFL